MKRKPGIKKRSKGMLNTERRRSRWRNHHLRLIDRRQKSFYQLYSSDQDTDSDS